MWTKRQEIETNRHKIEDQPPIIKNGFFETMGSSEFEWRNGGVEVEFETNFQVLKSAGQFIHSSVNKPFYLIYLVEYYLGQFNIEDFKMSKTLNRTQLNELNEFITEICGIQIKCRQLYIKHIQMYNPLLCIRTTFSLS